MGIDHQQMNRVAAHVKNAQSHDNQTYCDSGVDRLAGRLRARHRTRRAPAPRSESFV
jgi:hypothetical protein